MVEHSKIEWTDHTFNPWIGCQEVSPACDHCYARVDNHRRKWVDGWGPHGQRKRTSEANWKLPHRWNKAAERAGVRARVFCASLADVFDNQVPCGWRDDLWVLIAETPHLDWLLLTKRPQNIERMLPGSCVEQILERDAPWGLRGWPNVWLGTTAENQQEADRRIPHLTDIGCRVRFLSVEPLLERINLEPYLDLISWVIVGGESGAGHRPMDPAWMAEIAENCRAYDVPFFAKQMAGKKAPPPELMIRQFPLST